MLKESSKEKGLVTKTQGKIIEFAMLRIAFALGLFLRCLERFRGRALTAARLNAHYFLIVLPRHEL